MIRALRGKHITNKQGGPERQNESTEITVLRDTLPWEAFYPMHVYFLFPFRYSVLGQAPARNPTPYELERQHAVRTRKITRQPNHHATTIKPVGHPSATTQHNQFHSVRKISEMKMSRKSTSSRTSILAYAAARPYKLSSTTLVDRLADGKTSHSSELRSQMAIDTPRTWNKLPWTYPNSFNTRRLSVSLMVVGIFREFLRTMNFVYFVWSTHPSNALVTMT